MKGSDAFVAGRGTPPDGQWLTTSELAAMLKLKSQTVRKWRLTGQGPRYVRFGASPTARVLYRVADVEQWIAAHTYSSTAEETAAAWKRQ